MMCCERHRHTLWTWLIRGMVATWWYMLGLMYDVL